MNPRTERGSVQGPVGAIEIATDMPDGSARGIAVVCHPHPLHGGTLDNKVAQTLARAFVALGWRALRFNFRGVGGSHGAWDDGRGEVDDALAVVAAERRAGELLALAGFSFGGHVAAAAAARLGGDVERLVLVAPAVTHYPTPAVPATTLVVHGEADDVVPLAACLDWARPQSLPVTVIPGAGHFFHGQQTLLKRIVMSCR